MERTWGGQHQKYHSRCRFLIQNRQAASPEGCHIALQSVNCGNRVAFCLPGGVPYAYINPVELIHTALTAQDASSTTHLVPIWAYQRPHSPRAVRGCPNCCRNLIQNLDRHEADMDPHWGRLRADQGPHGADQAPS